MCTHKTNPNQLEQMMDMIDEQIALEYRWVHKLARRQTKVLQRPPEKLHAAQILLADVRAALAETKASLETAAESAAETTVRLV